MVANMRIHEQHPGEDLAIEAVEQETAAFQKRPASSKDMRPSDEAHLSEYDKELADSFPASDPPSQP